MNIIENFLQLISDPTIAYLLLSFGSLGIFLELANPGGFLPGIIGVACFILGFYALGTLPVNWTGVLLIALAFGLFFLDIFVTSFGTLLIGGLAAFIIGSYMLIDDNVPGYEVVSRPVIWTSAALILGSALLIGAFVLKTLRSKPTTGKNALIGEVAVVRKALAPSGMVYVDGEYWSAVAEGLKDGESLPVGSYVEIGEVEGLRLRVHATSRAPSNDVRERSVRESIVPVR
jgi:membrane-bound serine protease (ClpP class)